MKTAQSYRDSWEKDGDKKWLCIYNWPKYSRLIWGIHSLLIFAGLCSSFPSFAGTLLPTLFIASVPVYFSNSAWDGGHVLNFWSATYSPVLTSPLFHPNLQLNCCTSCNSHVCHVILTTSAPLMWHQGAIRFKCQGPLQSWWGLMVDEWQKSSTLQLQSCQLTSKCEQTPPLAVNDFPSLYF